MKPGLLQWVELEIPAYLTMLALGVLLFFILTLRASKKAGLPSFRMWFFLVICYLSGLVGARLFFVLEHFPFLEDTATPASLEPGGFSAFGTAIFASLVAVLVIRRLQMPIGPVFDSMVLGLCALVAVGPAWVFLRRMLFWHPHRCPLGCCLLL